MTLVQRADGKWFDPDEPTHCRTCGGKFIPHGFIRGFDMRPYWYCSRPDHVGDEASRFTFKSGPQTLTPENLGTPDHGVMGP